MKMEIVVADADGADARTITNFGCASFAPTFTPDGKKILFASNKNECDGRKFELFLMNLDGTGLEQVTDFGGFTSFPEFSPDGKAPGLLFRSRRQRALRVQHLRRRLATNAVTRLQLTAFALNRFSPVAINTTSITTSAPATAIAGICGYCGASVPRNPSLA